jgi:signal transduction histidine kinase
LLPIVLGWLWLWGQRAGVWSRADGPSVFVVASSVALVWLIARSARVVHATDVQRARLLVREQAARRDAESANRTKGDFLAVMSHELRTPLSAIIGYQELLADGITGPVNEAQQQQLGRIKVSARHLLQLIDEILTYSRAEAGKEEVRYDVATVNAILDEAAALIEPLAAEKGVAFSVGRLDASVAIQTDPHKVRQILVNLLSNAIKFTDPGGNVSLRAREGDAQIELAIADTGIGIPTQYLDRIFDPFWQVEQKATRRAGGTGLGLAVSRRLARLLGGEIVVTSVVGRGSVFTVTLPAQLAARPVSAKSVPWSSEHRSDAARPTGLSVV